MTKALILQYEVCGVNLGNPTDFSRAWHFIGTWHQFSSLPTQHVAGSGPKCVLVLILRAGLHYGDVDAAAIDAARINF